MTTISFFIELAGILTTDGAAVKVCNRPRLFWAQAQQKGARHAQRWGLHATSIAAGRAKESTTHAKRGATRDDFWPSGGKKEHDPRKDGGVMRHQLPQVVQKKARHVQRWVRHATSSASRVAKDGTTGANRVWCPA